MKKINENFKYGINILSINMNHYIFNIFDDIEYNILLESEIDRHKVELISIDYPLANEIVHFFAETIKIAGDITFYMLVILSYEITNRKKKLQ